MTREEAIEVLENGGWWDSLIPVTTIEGRIEDDKLPIVARQRERRTADGH